MRIQTNTRSGTRHGWLMMALTLVSMHTSAAMAGTEQNLARRRTPVVEAYERARDTVVNIATTEKVDVNRWGISIFGDIFTVPSEREERSVGSGVIIHEDGYIVTNAHVVRMGAELTVTLVGGETYDARVIGKDADRDLAVIKIEADKPLTPVALGHSDDLMIGETTIAVGNPVGLQNTVTTGVISAVNRELQVSGHVVYRSVIQTDASINPGNSGGALLNINGELIGINTAVRTDAQNIGFAIPVDLLRDLLPDILSCEKLNKIQVGLRVSGAKPARVVQIREGSPADQAGLELGDVIRTINGKPFTRDLDLYIDLLGRSVGDSVKLGVQRDGKTIDAHLTLTAVPQPDGVQLAAAKLGMAVADISEEAAHHVPRRLRGGVIVISVERRSPAERVGLKPGDLLVTIGRYGLTGVAQLGTLLTDVEPGDPIDFEIIRRGARRFIAMEGRMYAR